MCATQQETVQMSTGERRGATEENGHRRNQERGQQGGCTASRATAKGTKGSCVLNEAPIYYRWGRNVYTKPVCLIFPSCPWGGGGVGQAWAGGGRRRVCLSRSPPPPSQSPKTVLFFHAKMPISLGSMGSVHMCSKARKVHGTVSHNQNDA